MVVVGDVNSTIACGAVARKHEIGSHSRSGSAQLRPLDAGGNQPDRNGSHLGLPVRHRTSAVLNLENECVKGRVFLVGNVMIDTLVHTFTAAHRTSSNARDRTHDYAVATFHRPATSTPRRRCATRRDHRRHLQPHAAGPAASSANPRVVELHGLLDADGNPQPACHRTPRVRGLLQPVPRRQGGDHRLGRYSGRDDLPGNSVSDDAGQHRTSGHGGLRNEHARWIRSSRLSVNSSGFATAAIRWARSLRCGTATPHAASSGSSPRVCTDRRLTFADSMSQPIRPRRTASRADTFDPPTVGSGRTFHRAIARRCSTREVASSG